MQKRKNLILILTILIFFSGSITYSQNKKELLKLLQNVKEASYYDSLNVFTEGNKVIQNANSENLSEITAEVFIYYGNHFYYVRNLDRAKYYFELALAEAEKTNCSHLIILAKIRLAYIQSENEDFKNIEKELFALAQQAQKQNDFENVAEILNMRGIYHEKNGDPKTTANLYLEGLNLAKKHNLDYYQATFHNNLGLLKYTIASPESALPDFSEVIKIAKKINNKRLLSHAQLNVCLVLVSQKNYKQANELFAEVLQYASKNHHPLEMASAYANLGGAYVQNKNFVTGLLYIDSAIYVLKKFGFKSELIRVYLGKSNVELELDNFKESEKALMNADTIIRKNKITESVSDYYYMYYLIFSKKKEYKKALDYHVLYTKAKEDIQVKLNTKALEELQLKYNIQQKEIDLEKEKTKSVLLEKSHQEEIYLRWTLIGVALITITLILVVVYNRYYRAIRKQQAQFSRQLITNTEEERSRIAKDLHDDIGQSLSILKSKFTNKNQFENSDIISKEIERVIDQTRQISRNLFPSYLEKIGLKRAIAGLAETVQNSNHIECSYEVADEVEKIPSESATHVFRIIQECLNNTIKHSQASALKIAIAHSNNDFILTYMDNGNWKKATIKEQGVGLLSIKERAKIIGGNLQIDENEIKGFKLTLKFTL